MVRMDKCYESIVGTSLRHLFFCEFRIIYKHSRRDGPIGRPLLGGRGEDTEMTSLVDRTLIDLTY